MRLNEARVRGAAILTCFGLLAIAFVTTRDSIAGQAAVSLSRPGQDDLSFWVNHNGLVQFEVEGEVGFGDMARILLRRRTNGEPIRELRDRFTFRVQEPAALQSPRHLSRGVRQRKADMAERSSESVYRRLVANS